MNRHIYIFGHKNPDTDSICSAIAYAELKRQLGYKNAKAYRIGPINQETKFVLDYFGVSEPELITDVSPTLNDLKLYTPEAISARAPVKEAWDSLNSSSGSRILPVKREDGKVTGIVSTGDITNLFMGIISEDLCTRHEILFDNLLKILDIDHLKGRYPYDKVEGAIYIGSAIEDYSILTQKDIVITNNMAIAGDIARKAVCGCLILTNSQPISDVQEADFPIASVKSSLFLTINLISHAVSVGSVMVKGNFVSFSSDSYIDDVIDVIQSSAHRNFPVIDRDGQITGIVSRRHLIEYNKKSVILVDHNERSQSVDGIEKSEILEIIDHHRVADVQTDSPLLIRSEPLGSTATIIYKLFMETQCAINRKTAGILLSAILSDTLKFISPTSTEDDKKAADRLARVAEVDLEQYSREMFAVSTSLQNYTTEAILSMDRKQFIFGRYVAYISQVNTLDFKSIVDKAAELICAMKNFTDENNCDLYVLMITNIGEGGSELLAVGRGKELLSRAFGMRHDDRSIYLPGIVSRKKQIVPKLTVAANNS